MRMIRVQKKGKDEAGTLLNTGHIVCVTGNDDESWFHMTDGRKVQSSWPLDNAYQVLRGAME